MQSFCLVWILLRALLGRRDNLAMENLALRQQLAILKRKTARPRLLTRRRTASSSQRPSSVACTTVTTVWRSTPPHYTLPAASLQAIAIRLR